MRRSIGIWHLPIALDRWSPCKVFTSLTSKESKYKSSIRNKAIASCGKRSEINQGLHGHKGSYNNKLTFTSNPNAYAFKKSAPFCNAPTSFVSREVCRTITSVYDTLLYPFERTITLISTHRLCTFILTCRPAISVRGTKI